jgi:hypothetical protein
MPDGVTCHLVAITPPKRDGDVRGATFELRYKDCVSPTWSCGDWYKRKNRYWVKWQELESKLGRETADAALVSVGVLNDQVQVLRRRMDKTEALGQEAYKLGLDAAQGATEALGAVTEVAHNLGEVRGQVAGLERAVSAAASLLLDQLDLSSGAERGALLNALKSRRSQVTPEALSALHKEVSDDACAICALAGTTTSPDVPLLKCVFPGGSLSKHSMCFGCVRSLNSYSEPFTGQGFTELANVNEAAVEAGAAVDATAILKLNLQEGGIDPLRNEPLHNDSPAAELRDEQASGESEASAEWACSACTLLNADAVLACTVCGEERPSQASSWGMHGMAKPGPGSKKRPRTT